MDNAENQPKLKELIEEGFENTGKIHKVLMGANRGKEFAVYAQKGNIAGLVYNHEKDKIELVYKLFALYTGKHSRTSRILGEIKKYSSQ